MSARWGCENYDIVLPEQSQLEHFDIQKSYIKALDGTTVRESVRSRHESYRSRITE